MGLKLISKKNVFLAAAIRNQKICGATGHSVDDRVVGVILSSSESRFDSSLKIARLARRGLYIRALSHRRSLIYSPKNCQVELNSLPLKGPVVEKVSRFEVDESTSCTRLQNYSLFH